MIKPYLLLLVLLMLFWSCKQDKPTIDAKKMKLILTDLHYAEAYSMNLNKDTSSVETKRNMDSLSVYYRSILKHHKVSLKEFESSFNWYAHHPDELDSIYMKMLPDMTTQEGIYGD